MPILPILTYVLVLLVAYTWVSRGFFPALLHLACTIFAGAIAFAFYEQVAFLLMDMAPRRGIGTMLADGAFGISLGLLFALSVILARLAVDKLVPKNVVVSHRLNSIGGGVCGLGIGVLTIGMLVISVSHLRFGPALLGYRHLEYSTDSRSRGSIVRSSTILRPYVDKITAAVRKLIDQGWEEAKILKKMNNELSAYDPHTIRRLYDLAAGTSLEDDIAEDNLASAKEVKPGTYEVYVKRALPQLKSTGLARFRGEDWYIAGVLDTKLILKRLG